MFECVHCGRKHNLSGKRGLCWSCYHTRGVRELYPSKTRKHVELTEAELDAMIAENYPTMPVRGDDDA